ncbi:hypothetical protein ACROYT_G035777 [Oculina patagonica]
MSSTYHEYLSLMLKEEGHDSSRWIPCYHALEHGWDVSTFHQQCDNKGPTLSIIRKDNYVFGGFTERGWEEDQGGSNFELHFWRQDVNDYAWSEWTSAITQYTASIWIKTTSYPFTLFTFGSVSIQSQFVMDSAHSARLCFWIDPTLYCGHISAPGIDGAWHQLTVLWWDKVYWALFIDGAYIYGYDVYDWFRTEWYPLNGTLRIGQTQHPNNYATGSFIGHITSFNMWNYKMEQSEVIQLAKSCINTPGNMFQWSTFEDKLHGELKLVKPSTC